MWSRCVQKIADEKIKVRHRVLIQEELAPRGHTARMGYYKGGVMTTLNPVVLFVYKAEHGAAAAATTLEPQANRCLLFVKVRH